MQKERVSLKVLFLFSGGRAFSYRAGIFTHFDKRPSPMLCNNIHILYLIYQCFEHLFKCRRISNIVFCDYESHYILSLRDYSFTHFFLRLNLCLYSMYSVARLILNPVESTISISPLTLQC